MGAEENAKFVLWVETLQGRGMISFQQQGKSQLTGSGPIPQKSDLVDFRPGSGLKKCSELSVLLFLFSGGRGCLREGCMGLPSPVWKLRFSLSFPSFLGKIAV